MVGEPILTSLVGPANNGQLQPFQLVTDENGNAEVVFTAPDKPLDLSIRFSSLVDAEDVFIDVTVDPQKVSLSIDINYLGSRKLEEINTSIFEEAVCEEIAVSEDLEPVGSTTAKPNRASFTFDGLRADKQYAFYATGVNEVGALRASACIDRLSPNKPPELLELRDKQMELAGAFEITTSVDSNNRLSPVVEELASALEYLVDDTPGALLDSMHDIVASENSLMAEHFQLARYENDLDAVLANDFASRSIDIPGAMTGVWEAIKAHLGRYTAFGVLEIGATQGEFHELYHEIRSLRFSMNEKQVIYSLQPPEAGAGQIKIDTQDLDLVHIKSHHVVIGLDGPLALLFEKEMETQFQATELKEALDAVIGCDYVGLSLIEGLGDLADVQTIRTWCEKALDLAQSEVDKKLININTKHYELAFEGECRIVDPGLDEQVRKLEEGVFEVSWSGEVILGPMAASFEADLLSEN